MQTESGKIISNEIKLDLLMLFIQFDIGSKWILLRNLCAAFDWKHSIYRNDMCLQICFQSIHTNVLVDLTKKAFVDLMFDFAQLYLHTIEFK